MNKEVKKVLDIIRNEKLSYINYEFTIEGLVKNA